MDLLEIEDRLTKLLDMVTVPHPLKAPVIAEIASLRDDVVEYRGGRAKMRHGMIGHAREIIDILTEAIRVELDDERRVKESQAERNAAKPADTPAPPPPAEPESPCLATLSRPAEGDFRHGCHRNAWLADAEGKALRVTVLPVSVTEFSGRIVLAHRLPGGGWIVPCV